jgi:hypothetical protein
MNIPADWLEHLRGHHGAAHADLELVALAAGDVLRICTRNTIYALRMISSEREAVLATDRVDRPSGLVRIMGCTFGQSSTISPDRLFCGGSLELTFDQEGRRMVHTTSAIRSIEWFHRIRDEGGAT